MNWQASYERWSDQIFTREQKWTEEAEKARINVPNSTEQVEKLQYFSCLVFAALTSLPRRTDAAKEFIQQWLLPTLENKDYKQKILLDCREFIYMSHVVLGMPRVLNMLAVWAETTQGHVSEQQMKRYSIGTREQSTEWRSLGLGLFRAVFGRQADKVLLLFQQRHPDLPDTILHDFYGKVLSYGHSLPRRLVELGMVACLVLQQVPLQCKTHELGAMHFGASSEQVDAVKSFALSLQNETLPAQL